MKLALVNPPRTFEGSIYLGCRAPLLPLELGSANRRAERPRKKRRRLSEGLTELLGQAERFVPFVQANLLAATLDPKPMVDRWSEHLHAAGFSDIQEARPTPLPELEGRGKAVAHG